jgi:outer membrane protein assembly factor BamE (lipoprotein component of BamABCDE complex)
MSGETAVRFGVPLAFAVTLAILSAVIVKSPVGSCLFPQSTFDVQAWHSADPTHWCNARAAMAEDLMSHELTVGMARADVRALLGDPDTEDQAIPTSFYWVSCWMDCESVAVRYDATGRVAEVSEYQD